MLYNRSMCLFLTISVSTAALIKPVCVCVCPGECATPVAELLRRPTRPPVAAGHSSLTGRLCFTVFSTQVMNIVSSRSYVCLTHTAHITHHYHLTIA